MSAPAESEHTPWGLVILLGALTAMGPVAIDMYLPSLPAIGTGLHASAGQTQDSEERPHLKFLHCLFLRKNRKLSAFTEARLGPNPNANLER